MYRADPVQGEMPDMLQVAKERVERTAITGQQISDMYLFIQGRISFGPRCY